MQGIKNKLAMLQKRGEPNMPGQNENREKKMDEEYIEIVDKAIKGDLNLDIPNSTFDHALLLTERLLAVAKKEVNIFSGSLYEALYGVKIKGLLQEVINRGIEIKIIVWHKVKEEQVADLKSLSDKLQIKLANLPLDEPKAYQNTKHFLVVDGKSYRLEEPHRPQAETAEDFQVKGIANFNNPQLAKVLNDIFNNLWSHPSLISP